MIFYKVFNTLDSMIGYKNKKYIEFGWFAAKIDDILAKQKEFFVSGKTRDYGYRRYLLKKLKRIILENESKFLMWHLSTCLTYKLILLIVVLAVYFIF